MLKNLPFPVGYVLEIILYWLLSAAFYGLWIFERSLPIASLGLGTRTLPGDWEAGAAINQERFIRGFLISNHPATFAGILAAIIVISYVLIGSRRRKWSRRSRTALKKNSP